MKFGAEEFAEIIGGKWEAPPPPDWHYKGLCYKWLGNVPGSIVLLKADDYQYGIRPSALNKELASGGIILSGTAPSPHPGAPVLRVDSVDRAIRQIATQFRARCNTPIIAVTGTVGKTSSCYLLLHLLGFSGKVTTNGQNNFPEGVYCEMANLCVADYVVIEASHVAIGEATAALKPNVALLTQVSPVHLSESHDDLTKLTELKASLFNHLAPDGTAVINRDIASFERLLEIARKTATRILTFGEHPEADFRLVDYDLAGLQVTAHILGQDVTYSLGMRGRHMAVNSLGVLAAAHSIGQAWPSLLPHCATAKSVQGRGALESLTIGGKQVSLIDDSYNASPASTRAALSALSETVPRGRGRRVAVLADMLELGDEAPNYHRQLADPLIESGVEKVYLLGELMRCLWEQLPVGVRGSELHGTEHALRLITADLQEGDVILLKGSHGTGANELAADLRWLALVPGLWGAGPRLYLLLRKGARRIEPLLSARLHRFFTWQLRKFVSKNASRPADLG